MVKKSCLAFVDIDQAYIDQPALQEMSNLHLESRYSP